MNVYLPNLRLPSAYQEVEYIESSGKQCIDTGYKPSSNTEVETEFSIVSFPTDSYIYGVRNNGSGSDRRTFCMGYRNSVQKLYSFVLTNLDSNYEVLSSTVSLNTRYTTKQNNSSFYVNGVLQGSYPSHSSYSVGYNMYIFRGNIAGSLGNGISMKFYSMTIKNNGTLVRNFVPCYRKSDNVIGLYDLVNNQFYTNQGTGTFSKGNDVTMNVLKNIYIGEYKGWTPGSNTIAYWKYENNLNDSSGNNHTLSNTGSISYSSNPYAVNLSTSNYLYFNNTDTFNHDWTFNTWIYLTNRSISYAAIMSQGSGGNNHIVYITMDYYGVLCAGVFGNDLVGTIQTPLNQRINICVTFNYSTKNLKSFINGVKDIDSTLTSLYSVPSGNLIMGGLADNPSDRNWKIQGRLSNTILEASEWDETLPSTYYNQTKSTYGL